MTRVIFDISMSLDGFVNAANVRPEEPLGDGGERLHEWAFGGDERNRRELLAEPTKSLGAVIAGRRTYDLSVPWWGADGPSGLGVRRHPRRAGGYTRGRRVHVRRWYRERAGGSESRRWG